MSHFVDPSLITRRGLPVALRSMPFFKASRPRISAASMALWVISPADLNSNSIVAVIFIGWLIPLSLDLGQTSPSCQPYSVKLAKTDFAFFIKRRNQQIRVPRRVLRSDCHLASLYRLPSCGSLNSARLWRRSYSLSPEESVACQDWKSEAYPVRLTAFIKMLLACSAMLSAQLLIYFLLATF